MRGVHTMEHRSWDRECGGVGSNGRCSRGEGVIEIGGEELVDAVESMVLSWVVEEEWVLTMAQGSYILEHADRVDVVEDS